MPNSTASSAKGARNKGTANGTGRPSSVEQRSGVTPAASPAARPTYEEIAARAFLIYEREGRQPGRDVENWLKAEAELTGKSSSH
jgi:hypothetical protein